MAAPSPGAAIFHGDEYAYAPTPEPDTRRLTCSSSAATSPARSAVPAAPPCRIDVQIFGGRMGAARADGATPSARPRSSRPAEPVARCAMAFGSGFARDPAGRRRAPAQIVDVRPGGGGDWMPRSGSSSREGRRPRRPAARPPARRRPGPRSPRCRCRPACPARPRDAPRYRRGSRGRGRRRAARGPRWPVPRRCAPRCPALRPVPAGTPPVRRARTARRPPRGRGRAARAAARRIGPAPCSTRRGGPAPAC